MSDPQRPIDTALFDPDTAAADDFYRHVNGGWIDANPVPSEYGSWGAPQIVHARNQDVLHQLLEDAAARTEPRGSAGQMVGDYFAAAMDEAAIAAAGAKPLAPYLERIDDATSVADIRDIVRDLQRCGPSPLHSLGIAPDFKDSTPTSVRQKPPRASSPSRRASPRRPTPPSNCATCSSR